MAKEPKGSLPTSVRISPTGSRIWDDLCEHLGVSKSGLIEVLLREKARAEGIRTEVQSAESIATA